MMLAQIMSKPITRIISFCDLGDKYVQFLAELCSRCFFKTASVVAQSLSKAKKFPGLLLDETLLDAHEVVDLALSSTA